MTADEQVTMVAELGAWFELGYDGILERMMRMADEDPNPKQRYRSRKHLGLELNKLWDMHQLLRALIENQPLKPGRRPKRVDHKLWSQELMPARTRRRSGRKALVTTT